MANNKENQPNQDQKNESVLTPLQKEIMKAIETKNLEEFYKLLAENPKEDINFIDDDKMTPLQQAAYRGNADMVKLLLKRGADVNKCEHANDYTTLHFGALSGNVDVCHLLLAAGVKTNALNLINRTAAQLASFVGYHNIVSTINNFIPKADIDHYTKLQGSQTVPYLDVSGDEQLCENVYKFVLMYNMHPMKIALLLNAYSLAEHVDSVRKVLDLMSEKEMKAKDTNEVLGFKYHYLSFILGEIKKIAGKNKENQGISTINVEKTSKNDGKTSKNEEKTIGNVEKLQKSDEKHEKTDEKVEKQEEKLENHQKSEEKPQKTFIETFAKQILKVNRKGEQEFMDLMIRQAVKAFPHLESTLFRQMVASLTADENSPSALSIVSAAVNGQRAFVDDSGSCGCCGEEKATKKCAKCKFAAYCDKECQKLHWFVHKKMCGSLEAYGRKKEVQVDSRELNNDLAGILGGQ